MNKICLHGIPHDGLKSLWQHCLILLLGTFCPIVVQAVDSTQPIAEKLSKRTHWQALTPGIDYTVIPLKQGLTGGKCHAFKVNLQHNQISLALASEHQRNALSAKQFADLTGAPLAINGGFFNPDKQPLGLRIKQHQTFNPIRNISWWGVFYISHNRPRIVGLHQFHPHRTIETAIQAGPRLIINGSIPKLKGGAHNRSAICVNAKREVILLVTERAPITTTNLAKLIGTSEDRGGLGCVDALNLDGGASSQLYAAFDALTVQISNLSLVSDALVVHHES